jgi:hypothetical protein
VRREHDVLACELAAFDFADHVEDGHFTQALRLRRDFEHGSLPVVREPIQQSVVLARDIQDGRADGERGKDFLHAPPLRPKAADDSRGAGRFEPPRETGDSGDTGARRIAGALQALLPGLLGRGSPRLERISRRLRRPLFPAVVGPASRLGK